MSVIIDTPVLSEFLRRPHPDPGICRQFSEIVREGEAILLGPIRQEVLSGIKDEAKFATLRESLRAFPDEPILIRDFDMAAAFSNRCRSKGVQGSPTDFLICAICARLSCSIFTLDKDFETYSAHLPIRLHR